MNVSIITLGCKVNQYESQAIRTLLEQHGFTTAETEKDCDVVIINSCTVTGTSDQKMRQTLHRARRLSPNAIIVLTGCMPQAFPKEAEKLLGDADIIAGNSDRAALPQLIFRYLSERQPILSIPAHQKGEAFEVLQVTRFHERTRAFLKIQDGCNRFCSYCIIPMARGRERSKPLEALHAEVKAVSQAGYREVVLVGINLSSYGQELGFDLCDAVETAASIEGIDRVRLGSLEPDKMDDVFIQRLAAQPKLCPQFHLALQSGCDRTLKAMRRHYSTADYTEIVKKLRLAFPDCAITTDLMVGFPEESEEDFEESLAFLKKMAFAKTHVFPYSLRPGTPAAQMKQIPTPVKEARTHRMLEAAAEIRTEFLKQQIGHRFPVLFETACEKKLYVGYTPNYTPVQVSAEENLQNQLRWVQITGVCEDGCMGELIETLGKERI